MSRDELKEIIRRIINRMNEESRDEAAQPACVFNDSGCDTTSRYAVGEES